jgi:heptosyltransferase-2
MRLASTDACADSVEPMHDRILLIKTGALGDVLRTTSILPGLKALAGVGPIEWVTCPEAEPLVRDHPLLDGVRVWDGELDGLDGYAANLALTGKEWILSLDDELGPCRLATRLQACGGARLSGAYEDEDGQRVYTDDTEAWFGMGLLSRAGRVEADKRKQQNERTHGQLFASMLGIEPGRPRLVLSEALVQEARTRLGGPGALIGLNTGAGGRWITKGLDVQRSVELARQLHSALGPGVRFLVLGGVLEAERNGRMLELLGEIGGLEVLDGGTDNGLLEFAAQVACCDVLVSSDSLALHMAVALERPVVAFFAPTSGAEVDLFGRGRSIRSTSSDYCSYRPEADNSSITPERLCSAVQEVLNE